MELCTQKLIDASMATSTGLVLATRRNGNWDLVEDHEEATLRLCGEDPQKGYVEETDDGHRFVCCD